MKSLPIQERSLTQLYSTGKQEINRQFCFTLPNKENFESCSRLYSIPIEFKSLMFLESLVYFSSPSSDYIFVDDKPLFPPLFIQKRTNGTIDNVILLGKVVAKNVYSITHVALKIKNGNCEPRLVKLPNLVITSPHQISSTFTLEVFQHEMQITNRIWRQTKNIVGSQITNARTLPPPPFFIDRNFLEGTTLTTFLKPFGEKGKAQTLERAIPLTLLLLLRVYNLHIIHKIEHFNLTLDHFIYDAQHHKLMLLDLERSQSFNSTLHYYYQNLSNVERGLQNTTAFLIPKNKKNIYAGRTDIYDMGNILSLVNGYQQSTINNLNIHSTLHNTEINSISLSSNMKDKECSKKPSPHVTSSSFTVTDFKVAKTIYTIAYIQALCVLLNKMHEETAANRPPINIVLYDYLSTLVNLEKTIQKLPKQDTPLKMIAPVWQELEKTLKRNAKFKPLLAKIKTRGSFFPKKRFIPDNKQVSSKLTVTKSF